MASLSIQQIRDILRDKIPEKTVVAEHTESGHFYRHVPTNQLFASVTTKGSILDAPHLKKWAARLAVDHLAQVLLAPGRISIPSSEELDKLKHEAVLVHQDQFQEAGGVGTLAHGVIEDYLKEWIATDTRPADIRAFVTEESKDDRAIAAARSAELFCKQFHVRPVATEMKVASTKHRFAGTLDSLMMVLRVTDKGNNLCEEQLNFDGMPGRAHDFLQTSTSNPNKVKCMNCNLAGEYEFSIVDWKTSNSVDKVEYAMQTSAYWQALYEMTGLKPKRIYVVRLDKKMAKYDVVVLTNRAAAFKAFTHTAKIYEWLNDGVPKLMAANPKERVSLNSLVADPL